VRWYAWRLTLVNSSFPHLFDSCRLNRYAFPWFQLLPDFFFILLLTVSSRIRIRWSWCSIVWTVISGDLIAFSRVFLLDNQVFRSRLTNGPLLAHKQTLKLLFSPQFLICIHLCQSQRLHATKIKKLVHILIFFALLDALQVVVYLILLSLSSVGLVFTLAHEFL